MSADPWETVLSPRSGRPTSGFVFLVGALAYELKKPVCTAFLDFSTRQQRLEACRREVKLNQRLAPDVYLGVTEVTGVDGRPCDHLVVMHRMPEDRRLATLLDAGALLDDPVRQLARMLAAFHAGARRASEITAEGGRDALRARWVDNFAELRRFHETVLDGALMVELERLALDFLDGRESLLASRQRAGRIVDGHGDLLTGDIFCLDDGPRVLDCLEFDDRLRYLDGLDDAAFLAMDLEYRGAAELARAAPVGSGALPTGPVLPGSDRAHLHRTACPRRAMPGPGRVGSTGCVLDQRRTPRRGRRAGPHRAR